MPTFEEIFTAAEQAVECKILDGADNLRDIWRDTSPETIGFGVDSWLKFASGIVKAFNQSSGVVPINLSRPSLAFYFDKPLINFVVALADGGDQVS